MLALLAVDLSFRPRPDMRRIGAETLKRFDIQNLCGRLSPIIAFAYNCGHIEKGADRYDHLSELRSQQQRRLDRLPDVRGSYS
jgi:hypothetical protein